MMTSITTHEIPAAGSIISRAPDSQRDLVLEQGGARWLLSRRATGEIAQAMGIRLGRLATLAERGPVTVDAYLTTPDESRLWVAVAEAPTEVVAIATRPTTPLALDRVLAEIAAHGFIVDEQHSADGRLMIKRMDGTSVMIGNDRYQLGMAGQLDMAGHHHPQVSTLFEREVCVNGLTISVAGESRRVPQYSADGVQNACVLGQHLATWTTADVSSIVQDRLAVADATAASYAEVIGLHERLKSPELAVLRQAGDPGQRRISTIADAVIGQMMGDWRRRTGVADLSEIPSHDLRFLPAEVSVAGLIHLATECASHLVNRRDGNGHLVRWWNSLLQRPFDLEKVAVPRMAPPARWIPGTVVATHA